MNKIRAPKEINDKTNFIKAFVKKLAELGLHTLDDNSLLTAAEYYYQKAKQNAEDAAITHANFLKAGELWQASVSQNG